MKNIEETRNYFIQEIGQNKLMKKKNKKLCTTLSYNERFLILASVVTERISISALTSLLGIPIGITSSVIGLQICAITAGIKKYRSINKKRRRRNMVKQHG